MTTILVTGLIGSGKSEVCKYLESKGYPVYECDSKLKRLYRDIPGLMHSIEKALGISWSEIGIIFDDSEKRRLLETMAYPYLVKDIEEWKSSLDGPLAFIESAIATEKSQFDHLYEKVLHICAERHIRLARNPKAEHRDVIQSVDISKVDYTIENNSTKEALHTLIDDFLCKLI